MIDNKKILVVDDERDIRIFVSTVVDTMGLKPIEAQNGPEALKKARSTHPDLIILDIMIPRIDDGIQVYQEFRTDKDLANIPIIMLSAIARKTFFHSIRMINPRESKSIPDPEGYLEKPPDADELISLIENVIG